MALSAGEWKLPGPLLTEPAAIFMTIMVVLLVAPLISEFARLPGIVGLILGGILVGEHGFNLLATNETIELFATVGLIYLMFNAGLEIDLQQLRRFRYRAIVFAAISYILPQLAGIGIGRLAGIGFAGAVLLGASFASQTLVAQPLLSRLGIVRNQAVAITIGATVFTDIAALLVLAVVAGSSSGSSGVGFLLQISALSVIYAVVILFGVPRLGRLFFRRFEGNVVEFQFVLAVLFVAAVAAEAIGMHPIVGAFLAGLAINETLSKNARVVGHLHFVGTSFFVPLFLVTIGMRIDPLAVLADQPTWMLGLGLAAGAYTTKLAAAWVTARIYGYSRPEWMVMWGLSQAQAAATLATILVGTNAGVLPAYVLDAGILMILLTSVTSPYLVDRFGSKLKVEIPEEQKEPTFERIMVPLVSEQPPSELIKLAAALVKAVEGTLLLLNLAESESDLEARQPVADLAALEETNVEVESLRRIAEPLEEGLMHELTESDVSLLLLPWNPDERTGRDVFDPLVSAVIWETSAPVLAVRLATPLNAVERLVVALGSTTVGVKLDEKSVDVVKDMARTLELPLLVLASRSYQDQLERMKSGWSEDLQVETKLLSDEIQDAILAELASGDLVILTSMGSEARFRDARNHVPGYLLAGYEGSIAVVHVP